MKSTSASVEEKVRDRVGEQGQEAPSLVNDTHFSMEFTDHDPADQVRQSDHICSYTSSPLPSCFPFDTYPQDHRGQSQLFELSTVHRTTIRSSTRARKQPFSIYGTSSDYTIAEDLNDPVLPSPI